MEPPDGRRAGRRLGEAIGDAIESTVIKASEDPEALFKEIGDKARAAGREVEAVYREMRQDPDAVRRVSRNSLVQAVAKGLRKRFGF